MQEKTTGLGLGRGGYSGQAGKLVVLGPDGATLPGAWSELLTAATIVKHFSVGWTLHELSLGAHLETSCPVVA